MSDLKQLVIEKSFPPPPRHFHKLAHFRLLSNLHHLDQKLMHLK